MRTVQLDHSEIIRATQKAMVSQLHRDGRLPKGAELGLTFYSHSPEDMQVLGTLRLGGRVLHRLRGTRQQLCAIATQSALDRRSGAEKRGYLPQAQVRWRLVEFRSDDEIVDRFIVDVEFQERRVKAG